MGLRRQGPLLEDVAGLHYYREFIATGRGALSYSYHKRGERQCDFVLQIGSQKSIAIEFGLGRKPPSRSLRLCKRSSVSTVWFFPKTNSDLIRHETLLWCLWNTSYSSSCCFTRVGCLIILNNSKEKPPPKHKGRLSLSAG